MCSAGTSEPKDCTEGSYCEAQTGEVVTGPCQAGLPHYDYKTVKRLSLTDNYSRT